MLFAHRDAYGIAVRSPDEKTSMKVSMDVLCLRIFSPHFVLFVFVFHRILNFQVIKDSGWCLPRHGEQKSRLFPGNFNEIRSNE